MSAHAVSKVNAGTVALYGEGLNTTTYVSRAFDFLTGLVPADLNAYGALDQARGYLDACFDRYPSGVGVAFEAFGRHMHKYEPLRLDPAVNGGRPYFLRDFYSRSQLHDLDIFSEVYRPLGHEDHCFMHVPTEEGPTLFFGIMRDRPFHEEEREVFNLAQNHLMEAHRLAVARSKRGTAEFGPEDFARSGFTPRECDILYWLVRGHSNSEIGRELQISTESVGASLSNIYEKMNVASRMSAILEALSLLRRIELPAPFRVATDEVPD